MTATKTPATEALGRGSRGQAMVEYLVVGAVLLALVTVPAAGGRSALDMLLDAIRQAWQRFGSAISLPV